MRRFLARLIHLFLALLAIGVFTAGWYMHTRGFSRQWRDYVADEFRKRGIHLSCERLTLDFFHGIVAGNVRLQDDAGRKRTWAIIDRVVLDINYSNLLRHRPFIEAIDLHDAHLYLPIDPSNPKSGTADVSNLDARLLLPPHEAYLSQATADICGVRVTAGGRFANPEAWRPAPASSPSSHGGRTDFINTLLAQLARLRFEAAPPRLDIRFSGDLADPDRIFAEAILWGDKIRCDTYRFENIYAAVTLRDGLLELKRGAAADASGTLEMTANYNTASRQSAFQLHSSLDLQKLAHAFQFSSYLEECVFYSPPRIEINGRSTQSGENPPSLNIAGRIALDRFSCRSVIFDDLNAEFAWNDGRWYVSDFRLRHRSGLLEATALCVPGDFRARLDSTLDPRVLLPFLSGETEQNLADWDFREPPRVHLDARGASLGFDACVATGDIKFGRALMRGVPMNSGSAGLLIKNRAVTYQNFKIERDEGSGAGTFTYDFARHEIRLDQVKTTLNPVDAAVWVNPDLARMLQPYRFKRRPSLSINGVVDCDKGKNTSLVVLLDGASGMDYTFIRRDLSFPKVSARLIFTADRLQLLDVDATLFNGRVRGSADISLARKDPVYQAAVQADDIDFESFTRLYFDYADSHGLLSGEFRFSGRGDDPRALRGQGAVTIVDGNVFAIPVFGPLSGILNDIVPGMGYNVAHKGACDFDIQDGVIETRDFVVKGLGFSMIGGGKLFFVDDKMDFNIRLNAQGLPGVIFFPVSELFEYGSNGSMSKPVWRPKRIPVFNRNS